MHGHTNIKKKKERNTLLLPGIKPRIMQSVEYELQRLQHLS